MSKNLKATIAFLIVFFSFATIVTAAVEPDYEGISPTSQNPSTSTPSNTPPSILEEEPVASRSERINILRSEEQMDFQITKEKYTTLLQNQQNPNMDATSTLIADYKIKTVILSARYHKVIDLFYNYLLLLDQGLQNYEPTGFQAPDTQTELDQIEQELIQLSSLVDQFDATIDSFTGITEEELAVFTQNIQTQSNTLKVESNSTKVNLLELVEIME